MKKTVIIFVLCFLGSVPNASAYDSTGCGLGSLAFRGQRGCLAQNLAVTTNSYTQTFGITSNSSGCDRNGRITGGTNRLYSFLERNLDQFALDAARGQGETLDAIAVIMGTSTKKVAGIARRNFTTLFDSPNVSVVSVTLKMADLLA